MAKQRLAVFLDGTWNTRDDSTNVQHLHTLTLEGEVEDGVIQRRYYHQGVGTGVMDNFTGGGFGFGLEGNVRAAYNWLVEHYNDGDEIYVFGFSRGAFTARSLVGFISTCGLMRRGAPLTVAQLWSGYCEIGRIREERTNWWDQLRGVPEPPFRRLTELYDEGGRQVAEPENHTEELLLAYSRRVPITFLGVFDTVGAIGLDALAIPGLRSKLAQHHNAYPTKIISKCRHALAIDENRSSFKLTPFLEYIPNRNTSAPPQFDDRIQQRWFLGAHSNIGGGYEDNTLTLRPLRWMMEGAEEAGLVMHEAPGDDTQVPAKASQRRDSYAEFAAPVWSGVVRAKRHYRPIDRAVLTKRGYSLRTINESVDESVAELAKGDPTYAPPHLAEYAKRTDDEPLKAVLDDRAPEHEWSGKTLTIRAGLITWASFAVLGTGSFLQLFQYKFPQFEWWALAALAALFLTIDRLESYFNLRSRQDTAAVIPNVGASVLQAYRLGVVVLMALGVGSWITQVLQMSWKAADAWAGLDILFAGEGTWIAVPFFAAIAMFVLDIFERRVRIRRTIAAWLLTVVAITAATLAMVFGVMIFKHIASIEPPSGMMALTSVATEQNSGRLLLLQILLVIFYISWRATGAPMGHAGARLGSMASMQLALTPGRLDRVLSGWTQAVMMHWADDKEAKAISRRNDAIKHALWRDLIGFIPVYAPIMGLTMWLGMTYGAPSWWPEIASREIFGCPLWLALVLGTVALDIVENALQFRYLRSRPSILLLLFGALVTLTKIAGFLSAALVCLSVYITLTEMIMEMDLGSWRWVLASSITYIIGIFVLVRGALTLAALVRKMRGKNGVQADAEPAPSY